MSVQIYNGWIYLTNPGNTPTTLRVEDIAGVVDLKTGGSFVYCGGAELTVLEPYQEIMKAIEAVEGGHGTLART